MRLKFATAPAVLQRRQTRTHPECPAPARWLARTATQRTIRFQGRAHNGGSDPRGLFQGVGVIRIERFVCLVGLLVGAPTLADTALCTDRPTKSTGTCTAEAGHIQVESDLVSFSQTHEGDITATTWVILNPTLKYGLDETFDIEAAVALAVENSVSHAQVAEQATGVGDLYLKAKKRFSLGDRIDLALMPVVKLPTAKRSLGNGAVEWGLLAPVVISLDENWSLNLSPEVDRLRNQSGRGYHTASAQLINLGRTLPHDLTVSVEWWGGWDNDPSGSTRQTSLDVGLAWLARRDLQFDVGINRGLNAATPRIQAYVGIAKRY